MTVQGIPGSGLLMKEPRLLTKEQRLLMKETQSFGSPPKTNKSAKSQESRVKSDHLRSH